jgi:3-hydroxyisobutyrate dehydrogenase
MNVGIAGTGRMGTAMALRLLERGHNVMVWNREPEKTATATGAGASVAATPAALARSSDATISILTNAAAVRRVYTGKNGLLSGTTAGKLFIEMSTVRAEDHLALVSAAAAKSAHLLECPVSGTVTPAREGTLVGFAGGTPEAFAEARPLLEQLCRRVELIGPIGAGARMKLAANLLLTVFWQALAESCALVSPVTIEPRRTIDLLADSNIGATVLKARGESVAEALDGKPAATASFDLNFMRKDLRDMVQDAKALGVSLPVAMRTLRCYDQASRAGFGNIDGTQYPAWWIAHAAGKRPDPLQRASKPCADDTIAGTGGA